MWTIPAEELLAANDVGLVPWVPLARYAGNPETLLRECRGRIDRQAPPELHDGFLAVTHVLSQLQYNNLDLPAIFGGEKQMLELPFMKEIAARKIRESLLVLLKARFGPLPPDLTAALRTVESERQLKALVKHAATCRDLDAFRARLPS